MRALVVALLATLVAWTIAQLALDRYLVAQGRHELARVLRGESRIGFEFDQARELISGGADGVEDPELAAGVLRVRLPQGRANLRLNLRGLQLDASRFDRLALRIEVSAASTLSLIFDEPGRLLQLKREVSLVPGWNELELALDDQPWTPNDGGGATHRWGGDSDRVAEFRLYLAGPPGLSAGIDHVRFLPNLPPAPGQAIEIEWIAADLARERLASGNALATRPQSRLGVLLDVGSDTPERSLVLRDQVRARDAEALFWPASRALPEPGSGAVAAPTGASPGWALVVLYALCCALLRWQGWRLPAKQRAAAELAVGYSPLLWLSLGLGLAEQATTPTQAWMACALVFQFSAIRADGATPAGNAEAWRASLGITLIGAGALLAAALLTGHWQLPGSQRAALYVPFVVLQQLVLLGFLWPRAQALLPGHARMLAAALFALAHAPNFALMLLSMLAAWWWCALYQRHRAWLPILASHYLLGMLAISSLPPDILYSAEVGLRYFQVQ